MQAWKTTTASIIIISLAITTHCQAAHEEKCRAWAKAIKGNRVIVIYFPYHICNKYLYLVATFFKSKWLKEGTLVCFYIF